MNYKNLNQAIMEMSQETPEYNRGVLATIGKEDMAVRHGMFSRTVTFLCQKRDSMIPDSGRLFDYIEMDHATNEIQQQIYTEVARREEAWRPIQAMIDKAREL